MKNDNQSLTPIGGELDKAQLAALIEASRLINATLDHDEILQRLMILAAKGVDADRATLYMVDTARRELYSIVLLGEELREIRLPLDAPGTGLAGHVARTGETVNVADAYTDPRFNRWVDEKTGYYTHTVLAVPMCDSQGQISGVVQALNKQQGLFSEADEHYLLALSEHAAMALSNARLHAALSNDYERLSFLFRISSLMTAEMRLRDVLLTVMEGVTEVLKAEASSILLWDRRRRRLVFLTATGEKEQELLEIEVPLEGSIAGWVLQNEQAVTVNDVQSDPRFYPGADERVGFITRTMACAPMKVRGKVVGVLEVLNKQRGLLFDEADLQMTQAVADHTALAIENARRYENSLSVGKHHERRARSGFLFPLGLL